jgi:hypothetical protein
LHSLSLSGQLHALAGGGHEPELRGYDLGEKRENYLRIASLREYVVLHRERGIEVWFRSSEGWATCSAPLRRGTRPPARIFC